MTNHIGNPVAGLNEYEMRHAVSHLSHACRTDAILALLLMETTDGKNAWYAAKSALADEQGYVADIRLAMRSACSNSWREMAENRPLQSVGDEITYALMLASINSLATQLPWELVIAAVRHGIWTERQAIAYATAISNRRRKVTIMAALGDVVSDQERDTVIRGAIDTALGEPDDVNRFDHFVIILERAKEHLELVLPLVVPHAMRALSGIPVEPFQDQPIRQSPWAYHATKLLPWLSGEDRICIRASIKDAVRLGDRYAFVSGCIDLAKYEDEPERSELIEKAATTLKEIRSKFWRDEAILALAPSLASAGRTGDAIRFASEVADDWIRARAVAEIFPYLSPFPAEFHTLFEYARQLPAACVYGSPRAVAMQAALPLLANAMRPGVIDEIITLTINIDMTERARVISRLIPFLPLPLRRTIFSDLMETLERLDSPSSWGRVDVVSDVVPHLDHAETVALLRVASTIDDSDAQFQAEARVNQSLKTKPVLDLVSKARGIRNIHQRIRAFAAAIECLADDGSRNQVEREALALIGKIDGDSERSTALIGLVSCLSFANIACALNIASHLPAEDRRGGRGSPRDNALSALIPRMAELGEVEAVLDMIASLTDDDLFGFGRSPRAAALIGVAPFMTEEVLRQAIGVARTITKPVHQSEALAYICRSLAVTAPRDALDIAESISHGYWRHRAFVFLIPYVNASQCERIIAEAYGAFASASGKAARAAAFASLSEHLPTAERKALIIEALLLANDDVAANGRITVFKRLMHDSELLRVEDEQDILAKVLERGSYGERRDVLLDLTALMPLVIKAGGSRALAHIELAVDRTCRWWP